MAEKRKLLQHYMTCLNDLQDELKRKELEKKMRELELLESELARRQERYKTACAGGIIKKYRQQYQRKLLASQMRNNAVS